MSWVLLLLLLVAGLAWLTRHPEAEIVEMARDWPLVGALATRFRQAYLPEAENTESAAIEDRAIEMERVDPRLDYPQALSYVWVQPGDLLYEAPDEQSPVLSRETSIRNLSLLEQRGDWYQVLIPRPGSALLRAWVHLEDYQEPSLETLNQPEPVLPLPAAPPDSDRLAAARQLMEDRGARISCGSYPLITDSVDAAVLELCPGIARSLEVLYRRRYGVEPVSPPAEAIILFRRASAYRAFRDREQVPFESNLAHASPAQGYVALYQGDRSTGEILASLVHELTHLLNRRALGPALPPWLSEGIADDLAESRIDEDGSLQPGRLGGAHTIEGSTVIRRGAVAAAIGLQEALETGNLPSFEDLIEMDLRQFHDPDRVQLHYAFSSFWIRFLASGFDPDLQSGFREFLRAVGRGEPLSKELLLEKLGTDWQHLEPGFRTWLHLQFLPPPNESRDESL